jgi:Zn-dependent protease
MDTVVQLAIYVVVLAYSCIFHECAHVWVAWKLGDPTGKSLGRLTLNPVPHIDPFWTLILPLLTKALGGIAIGGPKPAPVDSSNFRNPRVGSLMTSLAGPASNLLLAALALAAMAAFYRLAPDFVVEVAQDAATGQASYAPTFNAYFLASVMLTNLSLAAFNMIPVPPLDGSRFLAFLLGRSVEGLFENLARGAAIPMLLLAVWLAPKAIGPLLYQFTLLLAHLFPAEYAISLVNSYFQPLF